jgi:RNA polymerase sigma-70 factor (ECF subfamily)
MQSSHDDIELMRRVAARDEQAFKELYQEYGKAIYSLAYRILQNAGSAEEVTQDAFLKVWQQRTRWDPERGKLKNWLLTITQFTAIDRLRQERRQPNLHPEPVEDMDERIVISLNELRWQEGTALRMLIAQLPAEQAVLIDLAFFQGMSHNDIAVTTNIPLGTVKTRLRTGIQRLRELWLTSEAVNRTSSTP